MRSRHLLIIALVVGIIGFAVAQPTRARSNVQGFVVTISVHQVDHAPGIIAQSESMVFQANPFSSLQGDSELVSHDLTALYSDQSRHPLASDGEFFASHASAGKALGLMGTIQPTHDN